MKTELQSRTLIAHIDGELDHCTASEIRKKLDREIASRRVHNLIFDFSFYVSEKFLFSHFDIKFK